VTAPWTNLPQGIVLGIHLGWAPIGFAVMATPQPSQYYWSILWSYLILSDIVVKSTRLHKSTSTNKENYSHRITFTFTSHTSLIKTNVASHPPPEAFIIHTANQTSAFRMASAASSWSASWRYSSRSCRKNEMGRTTWGIGKWRLEIEDKRA